MKTFVKFLSAVESNLKFKVTAERRRILANCHIDDVNFCHNHYSEDHMNCLKGRGKGRDWSKQSSQTRCFEISTFVIVHINGGKFLIWREMKILLRMVLRMCESCRQRASVLHGQKCRKRSGKNKPLSFQ